MAEITKQNAQAGDVFRTTSGTRPISVTVSRITESDVTLRCNRDWSYQGGAEFTLTLEKFSASKWQAA